MQAAFDKENHQLEATAGGFLNPEHKLRCSPGSGKQKKGGG